MNTVIDYLYRDAGNNKSHGQVILTGEADEILQRSLAEDLGVQFIPTQLGWDSLQGELGDWDVQEDHVWHECLGVSLTKDAPDVAMTPEQLSDILTTIVWDEAAAESLHH